MFLAFFLIAIISFLLCYTDNKNIEDFSNLYNSRDNLWKELVKTQQTHKRRDSELRNRIHKLERIIHDGQPRG